MPSAFETLAPQPRRVKNSMCLLKTGQSRCLAVVYFGNMATDKNPVESTNVGTPEAARAIQSKSTSRPKQLKKKSSKNRRVSAEPKRGPGRKERPYPLEPFQGCVEFAKFLYDLGSGQKVRRLVAFDKLGKSPEGDGSRKLLINSGKYGLIIGSKSSEHLELTPEGLACAREDSGPHAALKARFQQAIEKIGAFKFLFDQLHGNKLPNQTVMGDLLKDSFKKVLPEDVSTVVDLFVVNCKYLGLLKVISGAERLVPLDHALDELGKENGARYLSVNERNIPGLADLSAPAVAAGTEEVCFYVTPIGEEGSLERKHSDLFLGSIVEPALERLGMKVLRADQIEKPGTITKQIIQQLRDAKLVIADLSFSNPNVFYELAIRHAFRLPTVHIIRKGDKIPFDVNSSRTIVIDATDIYTLVPKLDSYRSEIANQVRQALEDPDSVDNPLTNVYPDIRLSVSAAHHAIGAGAKVNGN